MADLTGFDVSALPTYLDAQEDWRKATARRQSEAWAHRSGQLVYVPLRAGSDFDEQMYLAAEAIGSAERRPEEDVLFDLRYFRYDRLHVRLPSGPDGVDIEHGVELHEAVYQAVSAAARTTETPTPSLAGRPSNRVIEYMDSVRLIPSRPGSFVIRALLPATSALQMELDLGPAAQQPSSDASAGLQRFAAIRLMTATETAIAVAARVAESGDAEEWVGTVEHGVSAQLCAALALMAETEREGDGDAELSMRWTWAEPDLSTPRVVLPSALAPELEAASVFLGADSDTSEQVMIGRVTDLHREENSGSGHITLKGDIEGIESRVRSTLRFELSESEYDQAIVAHREGLSASVRAVVTREKGKRTHVERVAKFNVLRGGVAEDLD